MSIIIECECECDGDACGATCHLRDLDCVENQLDYIDWLYDRETGYHYCVDCAQRVKEELADSL